MLIKKRCNLDEADEYKAEFVIQMMDFDKQRKPKKPKKKNVFKKDVLESVSVIFDGRENVFHGFKSGTFSIAPVEGIGRPEMLDHVAEVSNRSHLKILSPKQILQRLPIAQLKAGNTFENFSN